MKQGRSQFALPWLEARLAAGPTEARVLLAAAALEGITAKMLRSARERLKVVVTRTGFGPALRSSWALADNDLQDTSASQPSYQLQRPAGSGAEGDAMAEGEARRTARRTAFFQTKGIDGQTALQLARKLIVERDRVGRQVTSCAQCQNLNALGQCRARMEGNGDGPRDVFELWICFLARIEVS